jgi:ferredoxin
MTVQVELDLCIAAGRCVAVAPEVFDVDENGFVVLLRERLESGTVDSAYTAAMVCPGRAITVTDSV